MNRKKIDKQKNKEKLEVQINKRREQNERWRSVIRILSLKIVNGMDGFRRDNHHRQSNTRKIYMLNSKEQSNH